MTIIEAIIPEINAVNRNQNKIRIITVDPDPLSAQFSVGASKYRLW